MAVFDMKGRVSFDYRFMNDGTPIYPGAMMTSDGEKLFEFIDHIIPVYQITNSLKAKAKTGTRLSFDIKVKCTNRADPGKQLILDIPLPPDSFVKAESNEGTFDPNTGKFSFYLNSDEEAMVNIIVDVSIVGSYPQTITLEGIGTSVTNNITVTENDSDGAIANHSINLSNYPKTLSNMQNGKLYTIVSYMQVHEPGVTGIHSGIINNCLNVVNDKNYIGAPVTVQDNIQKITCTFIYNPSSECIITWNDQYQTVSTTTEDRHYGLCINEGLDTNYYESKDLFSNPAGLIDDTGSAQLIQDGSSESVEYIYEIPVPTLTGDKNPFFVGLQVFLNSFEDANSNMEIWLETSAGKISNKLSTFVQLSGSVQVGETANMDKIWGLTDTDIKNKTVYLHLKISNSSNITQKFSYNNIKAYFYYQDDKTKGKLGFTCDGTHLKNYGAYLTDDDYPAGLNSSVTTLSLGKSDGVLITDNSAGGKSIKVTIKLVDNDLTNAQNQVNNISKWLSSSKNAYRQPIFKEIIFDYDPSRKWLGVLDGEITVKKDHPVLTLEATFLIPSGVAISTKPKITGASGYNSGLVDARPIITIVSDGSTGIKVTNIDTGEISGLENSVGSGTRIIIDCDNGTIKDEDGTDYEDDILLNNVYIVLLPQSPYNLSVNGGNIESVLFYEGS